MGEVCLGLYSEGVGKVYVFNLGYYIIRIYKVGRRKRLMMFGKKMFLESFRGEVF